MRFLKGSCYLCAILVVAIWAWSPNEAQSQTEPSGNAPMDAARLQESAPEMPIGDLSAGALESLTRRVNNELGLLDSTLVSLNVMSAGPDLLTLTVLLGNSEVTLELHSHSVRSPDYRLMIDIGGGILREVAPGPVRTYRGVVAEIPGSTVAAFYGYDGLHAEIVLPDGIYWITPIDPQLAGSQPGLYAVYRNEDVIPSMGTCGVSEGMRLRPALGGVAAAAACGTGLCVAEIACDADYEYYLEYGSGLTVEDRIHAVESRIITIIDAVNVQYASVGIRHVITTIIVRATEDNPYSNPNPDTGVDYTITALVNKFRNHWKDNHAIVPRGVAQLFTGKPFSGTIGLALGEIGVGTICDNNSGYSVVSNCANCISTIACAANLSAHELGHNWSAVHCTAECCQNECRDTMYPASAALPCVNQFNPGSISVITSFRDSLWQPNTNTCLNAGCTVNDDCIDELFCNGVEACVEGVCVHAGNPCPGPDGDALCMESCDEAANNCAANDPEGSACNDGLWCNGPDTCSNGSCGVHAGNPCPGPDGDSNCAESCREALDNCTASDPNNSACADDGNACTNDVCGGGVCTHPAKANGTACGGSVDLDCSAPGSCLSGICSPNHLASGTPCTDDGNNCTNDTCDGSGSCNHPAKANGTACNDSLWCNGTDTCFDGSCSQHAGNPCPGADGDANCSESCSESTGSCTAPDPNGSPCNDGLYCNGADICNGGSCAIHAGNPCPGPDGDGNCAESCFEAGDNCTASDPNGSVCNDGNSTTTNDACNAGNCAGTSPQCTTNADCNDNNACTTDTCVSGVCQRPNNTAACADDGNACTNDVCSGGACTHPAKANGTACNDNLYCNGADLCSAGSCSIHAGNPCPGADGDVDCSEACNETADACTANDPNGTACNDGNSATLNDQCSSGVCIGTACRTRGQSCSLNSDCCSNNCNGNSRKCR